MSVPAAAERIRAPARAAEAEPDAAYEPEPRGPDVPRPNSMVARSLGDGERRPLTADWWPAPPARAGLPEPAEPGAMGAGAEPEEGPAAEAEPEAAAGPTGAAPDGEVAPAGPGGEGAAVDGAAAVAAAGAAAGAPAPAGAAAGTGASAAAEAGASGAEGAPEAQAAPAAAEGDLSAWSARVRAAARTRFRPLPPPDVGGAVAPVRAVAARARAREAARRAGTGADVRKAVPKSPETGEGLPQPPPIPVPAAEAAVVGAVGKQLPAQTMPEVKSYTHTKLDGKTQVFTPAVGAPLPTGSGVTVSMAPPPAPPATPEGAAAIAKVRKAGAKAEPKQKGAGTLVLDTAPRPGAAGAPPGPPIRKADVATVLGRLRATTGADANAILVGAREGLYPRKSLQFELPDLGVDLVAGIQAEIGNSIEAIRSQAGIDEAAVEAAAAKAREAVVTGDQQAKQKIDDTGTQASDTIDEEGKGSSAAIAGARDVADDAAYEKLAAAQGGADPDAINARRDRLVERAYRRLAPEDIRYEREGKDRLRALELVEVSYLGGYTSVARQVAALIERDEAAVARKLLPKWALPTAPPSGARPAPPAAPPAPPPAAPAPPPAAPAAAAKPGAAPAPPPAPVQLAPATPAETWSLERIHETRAAFATLREQVATTTKTHRDGITAAKATIHDRLFEWAETEIGERSTWWDKLWARIKSWFTEEQAATRAWKDARDAALLDDMRGDLDFAQDLVSGARSAEQMKAIGAMGGLSEAQRAIVTAYFEGPEKGNPLAAVAAGMRVRIAETQREQLSAALKQRLMALPPPQWDPVAKVAESEGGGVVIKQRGDQIWKAVDQWGTDEDAIYAALGGLTELQRHALDLWYQAEHGHTLDWALRDEMSGSELDRAQALMRGDTIAADAAAIHTAIAGPGTDEAEIWRALRNKTPEERARLEQIYKEQYGETLEDALKSDLNKEEMARAQALREGNVARADAIGLETATHGKWYGGADTGEIEAIYGQIKAETEAQAAREGWTSEQLQAELLKRNKAVETEHAAVFVGKGGLQESFKAQMSGPQLDLALALAQGDAVRADAARLEIENGSFITSDEAVNKILESQYTRARQEVTLDQEVDLRGRRELAQLRGLEWNEKVEREAMDARIDEQSKERSTGYMTQLEHTFDKAYSPWGPGGLQVLIAFNMSGTDQEKARALLKQGGKLEPEQEVLYAVKGIGTDVDALKNVLKGKSPKQIADLEAAWATRYPHEPPLRSRIMEEVSGRDEEDIDLLLEGEPQTAQQRLDRAKRKLRYEQTAYLAGGLFSGKERKSLEDEVAKLEATVEKLKAAKPGSDEEAYLQWSLDQREVAVDSAVEEHRRSVDSIADTAAMIAAITAAVVVTALTWGAAGPAVAGMLGAIAATEATVGTKLLLKGSAYSQEELLVDVASGVVDAAMAFATAGVGNALLRVKEGIPVGRLARMGASSSMAKRMVAHGIAEGVEGFVSSLPSAVVGTLADENTWRRGDMLTNLGMGVGLGVGMGTLMSGAMGSLGGRAHPEPLGSAAPHLHGDPGSRAAQWHAQRALSPELDYDQFIRGLEAGTVKPDPEAALKFQRAMRSELTAAVPPGTGHLLEGVQVDVLSEAEFRRLTQSATGQAVTVIEAGKPRILLREGADVRVLREEGIHALQVLDTRTARAASLLDEAHMARWKELPLQTKLDMYRAKLDLEIDAQHTLIASLSDAAEAMPAGAERRALMEQLATASENLRNLAGRRVELDAFTMFDRLRARFGRGPLAERLAQPPRLFNKAESKKGLKVATKREKAKTDKPKRETKKPAEPTPEPVPEPKTRRQQTLEKLDPERIELDRGEIDKLKSDPAAPTHELGDEPSPHRSAADDGEVRRVGEPWTETDSLRGEPPRAHPDGQGDLYRIVEYYKDGKRVRTEETVIRGTEPPVWRKRGSDISRSGRHAEEASLLKTRLIAAERPGEIVSIGGAHQRRMGRGNGFDEVYFRFHPDGTAEIVIVEVKNYAGWVPFEDFTAVTGKNLEKNLEVLDKMLSVKRIDLPPELHGLTDDQLRALRAKLDAVRADPKQLTLEIRTAPGTEVGKQQGRAGTKPALTRLGEPGGFPGHIEIGPHTAIEPEFMTSAEALLDVELDHATRARFNDVQHEIGAVGGAAPPYRAIPGEPGMFRHGPPGAEAGVVQLRSVTPEQVGRGVRADRDAIEQVAAETVAGLQRRIQEPGFPALDLNVFLDVSSLDLMTRMQLEHAIDRQLAETGQAAALRNRLKLF